MPIPTLKTILDPLLNVLLVKSALGADQEIIGRSNSNYFAAYVFSGAKNPFPCFLLKHF